MVDTTQELNQKIFDMSIELTNALNRIDELKNKQEQLISFVNEKINEILYNDELDEIRQSLLELSGSLEDL